MKPRALILLPEAPYPAIGGGPLRSASILESLATRYRLEVIHFRLAGDPDPARLYPPGRITASFTLDLPHHSKSFAPRLGRNLLRALCGIPPLVHRFAGFGSEIGEIVAGQQYDLIWLEHFWLASYAPLLRQHTRRLILDLHNVESAYHSSLAHAMTGPQAQLMHFFARCASNYEARYLPCFDTILTTSEADAARIAHPAVRVLPNTIPWQPLPGCEPGKSIVFTGNFAYTPNQQALAWFLAQVWPTILNRHPSLTLRLVGKEIQHVPTNHPQLDLVGPVEDAVAEIARSQIAIVPLQSGSGTRLKILEAFAAGVPVISTSIGAEGLAVEPGRHLLITNSPADFAAALLQLLDDEATRHSLAEQARKLFEESFTWNQADRILRDLDL